MPLAVALVLALAALAGPAAGIGIDGRLTTTIYTYESGTSDTATASAARAYQGLRLDVTGLGVRGLSFHSFAQGTTDLAEQAASDPRLRLYQASLEWQRGSLRVQTGRQRVQSGVGSGSIDGTRGRASLAGLDVDLYAGLLVLLDKSVDLGSWDAGRLWGARVRTARFLGTDLALSFAEHVRQTVGYETPGRFSQVRAEPLTVERRLLGLDAEHRFAGGHRMYGRLDYDLLGGRARRSELSGVYVVSPGLSAQAEWYQRAPAVFAGSLLGVFPQSDYQEVGGRVYYQLNPAVQLGAQVASVLYDGDSGQRYGLSASLGQRYHLGYYRNAGYSGASDGLVGSVWYPLTRRLLLNGELDMTAVDEEADEREDLLGGSLGLSFRPVRSALLELELQGLRNPTYASDLRVLLRGSWHFFKGER